MEITTEFGIGDRVYYQNRREAKTIVIEKILITDNGIIYIRTGINKYDQSEFEADKCFSTKEECNLAIIEEIAGETRKE